MLIFVPLGDTHPRRTLAFRLLLVAAASLLLFATAHHIAVLAVASLVIGMTGSAVHVLVPFAAQLAPPERKGSAVGIVLSGLLLGILLARTVSGYIAQWLGWRAVYVFASLMMLAAALLIRTQLPTHQPDVRLSWTGLLRSALTLFRQQPVVREATLISGLLFFAFSAFWTTLGFFLKDAYSYGTAAVGNFGLVGAIGALAAPLLGKLADRMDIRRSVLVTVSLATVSFLVMGLWGVHLAGLIAGVLLLDLGMQGTHVANQTRIYAILPEARSRLNMLYMSFYFLAGSMGSIAGSKAWQASGWTGVCRLGAAATILAALVFASFKASIRRKAVARGVEIFQ